MFWRFCVVLLAVIATVRTEGPDVDVNIDVEITLDDGVLVLTTANFDAALAKHEDLLVEFYAPWCGHCKHLAPFYAKAAKRLADSGSSIKLAKVDATEEISLAEKHGVQGYPTLKFFTQGKVIPYNGGRTDDEIISWLEKKTGPPAVVLETSEAVKEFIDAVKNIGVIGYFEDPESADAATFIAVASTYDDHTFGLVSNATVIAEYSPNGSKVIIYRAFAEDTSEESKAEFEGEITNEAIDKFIKGNVLPLVVDFNQDTASKIFGGEQKSHVLMFLSKEEGHYDKYLESTRNVAKDFRGQVLFVTINADEKDHVRILEHFGMNKKDVPCLRLIRLEDEMVKFKPEDPSLEADNVRKFVQDYVDTKLKPYLLSQPLPDDWDKNPVKVLVSSNFEQVAMDPEKDVLVEFYAPWCGHCKQLAPIYEELGEQYKDNPSVVIAKMDATVNEMEEPKIASFPTIKLYKKGTNEVVDFIGERSKAALSAFIDSSGASGQAVEESASVDEDDDQPKKDEL